LWFGKLSQGIHSFFARWIQKTGQAVSPDINANVFTDSTWAFILDERSDEVTRLIARYLMDGNPRVLIKEGIHYFLETPHFVMQRKMLLNIKRLAEKMNH
jgi:hypothetical protein